MTRAAIPSPASWPAAASASCTVMPAATIVTASPGDALTIVAAGITVHEALAAAGQLASEGIAARVIDAYSVKPIDTTTLRRAARDTGRLITVEDHWPEGGLGEAVCSAFTAEPCPVFKKLAVTIMPGSAKPAEQLAAAGIDAAAIAAAARELVGG